MRLFDLFHEIGYNREVIIKDECKRELFKGKFGDASMRFACFKVCEVVEEDDIMIIYI